jgi:hypothetical protein
MPKKDSLFELFANLGIQLTDNDSSSFNILNVETRIFQSLLKSFLSPSDGSPNRRLAFLEACQRYLNEENNFLIALLPTKSNLEQVQTHSSCQDSLIKLLLEMDEIQNDMFDFLIQKLIDYSEMNTKQNDIKLMNIVINVPTYIIDQFRYQPKIVDPDHLCRKIMELISLCSKSEIKKQLILCIPDVLSDYQHNDTLINELESLLNSENTDLMSACLETLSNLKFTHINNQLKLANSILSKYNLINEPDLPSLIKFVLKSANQLNSKSVLSSLREKINLEDLLNSSEQTRLQIFNILKEYFTISNQLIELFINIMNSTINEIHADDDEASDKEEDDTERDKEDKNKSILLRPIDFLIFSIIYSLPQHLKTVDKCFKQILKEETAKNVENSIECVMKLGRTILNELFDSCLITLAKSLITSLNVEIYSLGQFIYKKLFLHLDKRHKHMLVQILIEHCTCSSSNSSRDNSLDVLIDLCSLTTNTTSTSNPLVVFSLELKQLINYIEYFNLSQIRKVYFVLCSIAYAAKTAQPKELMDKLLPQMSAISSQMGLSSQQQNSASSMGPSQSQSSTMSSNRSRPPLPRQPQNNTVTKNIFVFIF